MKEKPVSTKYAKTPRREPTGEYGRRREAEPLRETRGRIRKIVERHRQTLDHPAT